MKHLFFIACALFIFPALYSCGPKSYPSVGDQEFIIFDQEPITFTEVKDLDKSFPLNETQRLASGRIIVKKVMLPNYSRHTEATVKVSLTSNGDPWDKAGSLFIIPVNENYSLLDFFTENIKAEESGQKYPGITAFQYNEKEFIPTLELLRFMTPFGVGFYNDSFEHIKKRRPVYVPVWADKVEWQQDVTQLLSTLTGEVYIGAWVDTWTAEGYKLSASLQFDESHVPQYEKEKTNVISILNTTAYGGGQQLFDGFSNASKIEAKINLPAAAKNAKLYYIVTGHGGHAGGDEFVKKENKIFLNNKEIYSFIPWRDDCASFRRFNPHSGVWTEETEGKNGVIDERIASSDYSRSGWCPGSDVSPVIIELGNLQAGEQTFSFQVPNAQSFDGDKLNSWMVSAYLVYE